MFENFKIFHNWLRRRAVENRQMYPLVNIDTDHFLVTSTNMTFNLKILLYSFFSFIFFLTCPPGRGSLPPRRAVLQHTK